MVHISIKLLNHASVLIRCGDVALLTDPWYSGTCFRDGWGLRFHNADALTDASMATHLWISHFHTDHLHMPTLSALAHLNRHMIALTNVSANFDTREAIDRAGFARSETLIERRSRSVGDRVEVVRYPATGIDNMLAIKIGPFTILNYNDCNLPKRALQRLMRRIGPVDVLLNNFNHAGKLIGRGRSDDQITAEQTETFKRVVEVVRPRYVIPFASLHYYRAPYSQGQNRSLLSVDRIAASIPNGLALHPGDTAHFRGADSPLIEQRLPSLIPQPLDTLIHPPGQPWDDLVHQAERFRALIRREFFSFTSWIPALRIRVDDIGKTLVLDLTRGVSEGHGEDFHIAAHSSALVDWFGRRYGSVDFQVGAHYRIASEDTRPLVRTLLAGGLVENKLSAMGILRMAESLAGWRFLINRREEIAAILLGFRFNIQSRF